MHGMPGGAEWLLIVFVGCFAYMLPVLFAVFVIISLVKIRASLDKIEKRLDQFDNRQPPVA
jgi:hypothetical protein